MNTIYSSYVDQNLDRVWYYINEGNSAMAGYEARLLASQVFYWFEWLRE